MKKITKACPVCSKPFTVPACHSNRYVTCGHKCGGIYRQKPIVKNICSNCKIEFVSKKHPTKPQTFCSRQCACHVGVKRAVAVNSKGSLKVSITHTKICLHCGNNFTITEARLNSGSNRGIYCSSSCRITNWNAESIKRQMPGSYRINAWKVYEKKCYDCGITDARVLVIHHIDGNRKNGKLDNLIPVCHNCHCIRHITLSGNHRLPSYRGED